jgi:hypothetical protein
MKQDSMEIRVDPRNPSSSLEDLVQQMLPPDLSNVVTLRPEHKLAALSPEEAFIAWTMGLPEGSDVAAEARVALTRLQSLKLRHAHPALGRFERYLRDALTAVPGRGRRSGRRRGGASRRGA